MFGSNFQVLLFKIGASTGWFGLGLCPTQNRPDQIGCAISRLATN